MIDLRVVVTDHALFQLLGSSGFKPPSYSTER